MKNFLEMAIYTIEKIKEEKIEADPLDVGKELVEELELKPSEIERFLIRIYYLKDSKINKILISETMKKIIESPEYRKLESFFTKLPKKQKE